MLWFCFFEPKIAGEDGIERFFRSWGGEALYNSHERDPETGPVLKRIGTPCIVEAEVPISSLSKSWLTEKMARIFLKKRGLITRECCDFESYADTEIPPETIRKVIKFPEPEFLRLTDCENWDTPLTI